MLRRNLLISLLCLLPAVAAAGGRLWTAQTRSARVHVQRHPLDRIPQTRSLEDAADPGNPTQEEGIAIGAGLGSRLFRHLVDRQDSTFWYPVEFEPAAPEGAYDGSALAVLLPDSTAIAAREIVFCPLSVKTVLGGAVHTLVNGTAWNEMASHKGGATRYLAYAGFPRVFNPEKAIGIVFRPGGIQ